MMNPLSPHAQPFNSLTHPLEALQFVVTRTYTQTKPPEGFEHTSEVNIYLFKKEGKENQVEIQLTRKWLGENPEGKLQKGHAVVIMDSRDPKLEQIITRVIQGPSNSTPKGQSPIVKNITFRERRRSCEAQKPNSSKPTELELLKIKVEKLFDQTKEFDHSNDNDWMFFKSTNPDQIIDISLKRKWRNDASTCRKSVEGFASINMTAKDPVILTKIIDTLQSCTYLHTTGQVPFISTKNITVWDPSCTPSNSP